MIIDSHAHLNHAGAYETDVEEVLARARAVGVEGILNVATSPADASATVALARRHGLLAAVGIHPHEAAHATDAAMASLAELAHRKPVVAWGEIGLDYHYLRSPKATQREAFARQLRQAGSLDLPVIVHSREADADTVELIHDHAGSRRGVIHCFTGGWDLARACLDEGFCLSFSGILTFRNAEELRQVAARVPDERLLVETDSPYLAPVPHRGRRNEPAHVVAIVELLAGLRGVTPVALADLTSKNFHRLFGQLPADSSSSRAGA